MQVRMYLHLARLGRLLLRLMGGRPRPLLGLPRFASSGGGRLGGRTRSGELSLRLVDQLLGALNLGAVVALRLSKQMPTW